MSIMVIVFFTVLFQGVGCPVYFFLHLSQYCSEKTYFAMLISNIFHVMKLRLQSTNLVGKFRYNLRNILLSVIPTYMYL